MCTTRGDQGHNVGTTVHVCYMNSSTGQPIIIIIIII